MPQPRKRGSGSDVVEQGTRRIAPGRRAVSKRALVVLSSAAALLISSARAWGAAGDLDPSFGSGGTVTTAIGMDAGASAVALQPDGKIVAAGDSSDGSHAQFTLARYTPAGSLDACFGNGGTVVTGVGPNDSAAYGVALQADGKIVAAGSSDTCTSCGPFGQTCCTSRFAVARYTAAGSLDASFGGAGTVTTVIGASAVATDIALQADGKIIAAGISWNGSANRFAVARYTAAGSLDTSFAGGGIVTTPIGTDAIAQAVALQPDGKIIVAGYAEFPGSLPTYAFAVARYTSTGALDSTFGSGGTVTTYITPQTNAGLAVALQADGKILVAGNVDDSESPNRFGIARYLDDGNLDTSFGDGGAVTTYIGTGANVQGLAVQSDGKIIAAGRSHDGNDQYFALARYTAAGDLDSTFGNGGTITTAIGPTAGASSVVLQPDGRIVAAGVAWGSPDQFALVRYLGDCGNGVVDSGETCDDGNAVDGDCCSTTCQLDPAAASCDDHNPCTDGESCDGAGVCGGFTLCRTNTPCNFCGSLCTLQADECICE